MKSPSRFYIATSAKSGQQASCKHPVLQHCTRIQVSIIVTIVTSREDAHRWRYLKSVHCTQILSRTIWRRYSRPLFVISFHVLKGKKNTVSWSYKFVLSLSAGTSRQYPRLQWCQSVLYSLVYSQVNFTLIYLPPAVAEAKKEKRKKENHFLVYL